jgi:curli biogenesis system outer membrane secretion channel CsgG
MLRVICVCAVALLTMFGCATVSPPLVAVEAPVSQETQIKAQAAVALPAAKSYKRKVAIARFTNESNYGRSLFVDEDYNRLGKQSSDMLASQLIRSQRFIVLERPDLTQIERERMLTGESSELLGVDTLIVGSVTEFGRAIRGTTGFLSKTKVQVARAKVEVRLVDPQTGHAFFSVSGTGEADTESGEIAGFGSRADYDATLNDRAIAAAISDMIDQLISKLEERRWKTDILNVNGSEIYISGGAYQGLKIGDTLALMEPGATIKSRQSGFDIALPPKRIGTLRIKGFIGDSEHNEASLCVLTEGSLDTVDLDHIYVEEDKS